ncbi:VOC family protein [Granulicoccus phenolivorans]|uniref:VOC family protein n=1 Tax=Granulicoccus phenolivorans TaxID=266854 RepID=UPI000416FD92|nr:VOC family protein [Granulicoccus phenolivorans]
MPIHYSHATVRCADVQASAAFYRDILGFEVSPLAGFDFAIEEVRSAGNMFLHLIQVGDGLNGLLGRDGAAIPGRAALASNLEHLGLNSDTAAEAEQLRERLDRAGHPYTERVLEQLGVRQFLFDDPSGIELEIGFPVA